MKLYINILLSFLLLILSLMSYSQRYSQRPGNLQRFDLRRYHFGFILGYNKMDFSIHTKNTERFDSLLVIESEPVSGFNIGIVSDLTLNDYSNLRFIPSLSFGERKLQYKMVKQQSIIIQDEKTIESIFIDFPFQIKAKSDRFFTDCRAYVLAGLKYSIDLASQSDKEENNTDIIIKLKKKDLSYEIGIGFDFYLAYFKFGTELKMSYGVKDLLKRENNIYTNNIDKLNSKIFLLSFTFE